MKIFFFDIDGTLANGFDVPASAAYALKELRKREHLVFICTGRPDNYVHEHFGEYCDGSICFNGRYAELNEVGIYDKPLEEYQVEEMIQRMDEYKCGYVFYNNTREFVGGYMGREYIPFDSEGENVYNFNLHFKDRETYRKVCEVMQDVCIFNPHGPELHADATVIGSDKGVAITAVLKRLGIPKDDSYAFGDGLNDICMMEAAGHGICMDNGHEVTKAAAEYVTTDINDNGVYNALVHYRLIGEED